MKRIRYYDIELSYRSDEDDPFWSIMMGEMLINIARRRPLIIQVCNQTEDKVGTQVRELRKGLQETDEYN